MFRNYDWQCSVCGSTHEEVVEFPQGERAPRTMPSLCGHCCDETPHSRLIPMFARFIRAAICTKISGGQYDTMGQKPLTPIPSIPSEMAASPAGVREFFSDPHYGEIFQKREEEIQHNEAKRQRAALIRSGVEIDMRTNPLPGDPSNIAE